MNKCMCKPAVNLIDPEVYCGDDYPRGDCRLEILVPAPHLNYANKSGQGGVGRDWVLSIYQPEYLEGAEHPIHVKGFRTFEALSGFIRDWYPDAAANLKQAEQPAAGSGAV